MGNLATLLQAARNLAAQDQFDIEEMLLVLANVPMNDLDVQSRGAVVHARNIAAADRSSSNSRHTAMTRYALARVVSLLERHSSTVMPRSEQAEARV